MNFRENTGKSIQSAFDEFHRNNPFVYDEFKKMVNKAIACGKNKVSAKLVINVIRWNQFMETVENTIYTTKEGEKKKFRINDAYTSRYARLYLQEYPDREQLFNSRELRSS